MHAVDVDFLVPGVLRAVYLSGLCGFAMDVSETKKLACRTFHFTQDYAHHCSVQ
jgi:hypothetical protein